MNQLKRTLTGESPKQTTNYFCSLNSTNLNKYFSAKKEQTSSNLNLRQIIEWLRIKLTYERSTTKDCINIMTNSIQVEKKIIQTSITTNQGKYLGQPQKNLFYWRQTKIDVRMNESFQLVFVHLEKLLVSLVLWICYRSFACSITFKNILRLYEFFSGRFF